MTALAPKSASVLAPACTQVFALRWLGHDRPDQHCCEPIGVLNPSAWFIPCGQHLRSSRRETLFLVDSPETGNPRTFMRAT
jgi:hypothetical protein